MEQIKIDAEQQKPEQGGDAGNKPDIFSEGKERIDGELDAERIESLETAKKEIAGTEPPKPEAVTPDHAPSDIDLDNLSPEKIKERHDQLVERYREQLDSIQPTGVKLETDERGQIAAQEITADKLVFVHATSFAPKVETDGSLRILNDQEATDGKVPRITTHFALNHRVSANSGGRWDNKEYQIIMPGNDMLAANGRPANLMAVDTFYAKSVTLPPGTVMIYEKGYRPNIPDETIKKNKIVLIERDQNTNDSELVNIVTDKMGYSRITGGGMRSSDPNINEGISKFAEANEMTSHAHFNSWSYWLENAKFGLSDGRYDKALQGIEAWYSGPEYQAELANMPIELRRQAVEGFLDIFKRNADGIADEKLKTDTEYYQLIGGKFIDHVLYGDYYSAENGRFMSEEDRRMIIESIPSDFWSHKIEEAKKNIGRMFKNEEEMKSAFLENYAEPYEKLTGKPLDLKTLGL